MEAPRGWEGLAELGRTAHWFWAFDDLAVMIERPALLGVDSRGLVIRPGRPTVVYPDGWAW